MCFSIACVGCDESASACDISQVNPQLRHYVEAIYGDDGTASEIYTPPAIYKKYFRRSHLPIAVIAENPEGKLVQTKDALEAVSMLSHPLIVPFVKDESLESLLDRMMPMAEHYFTININIKEFDEKYESRPALAQVDLFVLEGSFSEAQIQTLEDVIFEDSEKLSKITNEYGGCVVRNNLENNIIFKTIATINPGNQLNERCGALSVFSYFGMNGIVQKLKSEPDSLNFLKLHRYYSIMTNFFMGVDFTKMMIISQLVGMSVRQ